MPKSLSEYGIKEDAFKSKLNEISQNALADACVEANPIKPNVDDLKQIFTSFAKASTG